MTDDSDDCHGSDYGDATLIAIFVYSLSPPSAIIKIIATLIVIFIYSSSPPSAIIKIIANLIAIIKVIVTTNTIIKVIATLIIIIKTIVTTNATIKVIVTTNAILQVIAIRHPNHNHHICSHRYHRQPQCILRLFWICLFFFPKK